MLIKDNWENSSLERRTKQAGMKKKHRIRRDNISTSSDQLKKLFNPDFFPPLKSCAMRSSLGIQGMDGQSKDQCIRYPVLPVFPTWGSSVPIQQVVIFGGVKVHDNTGSIKQLLVTAGTGNAVVTVPGVSSVIQLLRLHLAMHPSPG